MNAGCKWILRGDHYDCLHNGGGRGIALGNRDFCASCQEKMLRGILTLGEALIRHEAWCGFNRDAPGDGIHNRAAEVFAWLKPWAEYQASKPPTSATGNSVAPEPASKPVVEPITGSARGARSGDGPTAISGTWSDLERSAELVHQTRGEGLPTREEAFAEGVLVLLGQAQTLKSTTEALVLQNEACGNALVDAERKRDGLLSQRWSHQNRAEVAERGHKAASARNFEQRDEIKRLRDAIAHVVADSPGTPDSVKDYLKKELTSTTGGSAASPNAPESPRLAAQNEDEPECPECEGAGWVVEIGHEAACHATGDCVCSGVQEQATCRTCGGSGSVPACDEPGEAERGDERSAFVSDGNGGES